MPADVVTAVARREGAAATHGREHRRPRLGASFVRARAVRVRARRLVLGPLAAVTRAPLLTPIVAPGAGGSGVALGALRLVPAALAGERTVGAAAPAVAAVVGRATPAVPATLLAAATLDERELAVEATLVVARVARAVRWAWGR